MRTIVEPVLMDVHLPAGVAGPDPFDFDVRCYVVTHASGVALVDAGMAGSHDPIDVALTRVGAGWHDITDVMSVARTRFPLVRQAIRLNMPDGVR
jgi:hypothetical protein